MSPSHDADMPDTPDAEREAVAPESVDSAASEAAPKQPC